MAKVVGGELPDDGGGVKEVAGYVMIKKPKSVDFGFFYSSWEETPTLFAVGYREILKRAFANDGGDSRRVSLFDTTQPPAALTMEIALQKP